MVDDADAVLHDEYGASLVKKALLGGGSAGVSVNVVLADITAFEGDSELMRALMSADCKQAFMPQGRPLLNYLEAKYRLRRTTTWVTDDRAQFVVHLENDHATLGFAAAWIDARTGLLPALEWASHHVEDACEFPPQPWEQHDADNCSWTTFSDVWRWGLHRHQDVWLLTSIIAEAPCTSGPAAIEWAEKAIDARFEAGLGSWQLGPGVGAPESEVLYVDATGPITPKDQSESIKQMIAGMY